MGKGGKMRVVFLSANAKEWLAKYLHIRKDADAPLFIRYSAPTGEEGLTVEKIGYQYGLSSA